MIKSPLCCFRKKHFLASLILLTSVFASVFFKIWQCWSKKFKLDPSSMIQFGGLSCPSSPSSTPDNVDRIKLKFLIGVHLLFIISNHKNGQEWSIQKVKLDYGSSMIQFGRLGCPSSLSSTQATRLEFEYTIRKSLPLSKTDSFEKRKKQSTVKMDTVLI